MESFYKSQLMSTAPVEISFVKVKDSDEEMVRPTMTFRNESKFNLI